MARKLIILAFALGLGLTVTGMASARWFNVIRGTPGDDVLTGTVNRDLVHFTPRHLPVRLAPVPLLHANITDPYPRLAVRRESHYGSFAHKLAAFNPLTKRYSVHSRRDGLSQLVHPQYKVRVSLSLE